MPESSPLDHTTGQAVSVAMPRSKSAAGPYSPPLNALVRTLPIVLRYSGKVWWNEYIGRPFSDQKGTPNGGAMGWVRRMFLALWWPDNMPGVDISDKDKLWYFDQTKVGSQIYLYLDNSTKRGTQGRDPDADKDGIVIKLRDRGEYHWRRANPTKYDEAVEKWVAKHRKDPNFGELGAICGIAFRELPQTEQDEWNAVAKQTLEASKTGAQLSTSLERSQFFHKQFNKDIDGVLKQGECRANVRFIGAVVHEKPDGTLKIDRKFSDSLRAFSNNPAVSNLLHVFGDWLKQNDGESVESGVPTATVYPNYAKENYPMIPNYVGWTLDPLQGLVRKMIHGIFVFQGAFCRVMWTEIQENPTKFIDPRRILSILLENWKDPSKYSLEIASKWADFLLACQNGSIPFDIRFQFALIPAGPRPINKSDSQEDDRVQVERDGKKVWMLKFTRTVDRLHQPKGPNAMLDFYSKGAISYADHVRTGQVHAHSTSAPPRSWLGLPGADPSIPAAAMCPAEVEYWLDLTKFLPDSSKDRVKLLLDRTNRHQSHLPATDPKGIYKLKKPLPILFPSSPQPSSVPSTFYLPGPMCQRNPPQNATIGHFEECFEEVLDNGLLVHEASGTLFGGDTGVVGLSRPLLHLVFTFSVARREFNPPEDPPAGHDLSRLPLQEWDRLLGWINRLSDAIAKSTETLAQTSAERKGGLDHLHSIPSDDTATVPGPSTANNNGPPVASGSHALVPMPNPRPKPKPKPRRKRAHTKSKKGKERAISDEEMSEASPEPESGGEEQDYDTLDKTPQDDESEDSFLGGENSFHDPPPIVTPSASARKPEDDSDDSDTDRLELERRYGFSGVESVEPGEYNDELSTEWVHTDEVFGKFDELPTYEPLRFHTPNALILHIEDITRSCRRALEDFDKFLDLNPHAPLRIHEIARAKAQDFPRHQILYEFIFLRRGIWHESARVAVDGIFQHGKHIALIVREATQAQLMAHNTLQNGVFPDPQVGPMELALPVRRLNMAACEARWTFKELLSFQAHATNWYNKLEGNWLYGDVPSDLPTLVQVVKGLIDWCDETMAKVDNLRTKRKIVWDTHVSQPFDQKHTVSGMKYRFGCPIASEEQDGLRDAFTRAKALLETDLTRATGTEGSGPPGSDQPGMNAGEETTSPITPTPTAVPAPVVPTPPEKSTSEPAATSEGRDSTPVPTTQSNSPSPPSPKSLVEPSPTATPAPAKKSSNKRKRVEEPPESNPRRTSKRLSEAAPTNESDMPKTRGAAARANVSKEKAESAAAKKGDKNGKIASGKKGNPKRSKK